MLSSILSPCLQLATRHQQSIYKHGSSMLHFWVHWANYILTNTQRSRSRLVFEKLTNWSITPLRTLYKLHKQHSTFPTKTSRASLLLLDQLRNSSKIYWLVELQLPRLDTSTPAIPELDTTMGRLQIYPPQYQEWITIITTKWTYLYGMHHH